MAHLEKLVHNFFKRKRGHDGKVNLPAQVDHLGFGHVSDLHRAILLIHHCFLTLFGFVVFVFILIFVVRISKNFLPNLVVLLLIFPIVGIVLEDVQSSLDIMFSGESNIVVRDLVVVRHQIELLDLLRIILEVGLPHSEQPFNHVLYALVDFPLVKNGSESLEYDVHSLCRRVTKSLAAFFHKIDGDFDGIVGRSLQEKV
mmetsp:Transcript_34077/g.63187  ORF Transcript_34077/g.63187 Transcript_34077/m.63187 type:complete len:200 (+) Transcript_34077:1127-1726(+)